MKPTEQQLKDPQWWDDFQPKGCELLLVCNDPEGDDLWAHFNGHRYEVGAGSYSFDHVVHNYTIHHKTEFHGNNEKHDAASKFIPEAGEWCEAKLPLFGWIKLFIVGKDSSGCFVFHHEESYGSCYRVPGQEFRPIKSERDVQAEKFAKVLQKDDQEVTELCNRDVSYFMSGGYALYDNGARFNDE